MVGGGVFLLSSALVLVWLGAAGRRALCWWIPIASVLGC